jgi:hypothetical protein
MWNRAKGEGPGAQGAEQKKQNPSVVAEGLFILSGMKNSPVLSSPKRYIV